MPLAFYKCEYCYRTYSSRSEAVRCEQSHPAITRARAVEYMLRDTHPLIIEVEFDNGRKVEYVTKDDVTIHRPP